MTDYDARTRAMGYLGIEPVEDRHVYAMRCLTGQDRWDGDPLPEAKVQEQVAAHRLKIAWGEVEYAAGHNRRRVGIVAPRPDRLGLIHLIDLAFEAEAAHREAQHAVSRAAWQQPPKGTT